jgi:hypothetical protein
LEVRVLALRDIVVVVLICGIENGIDVLKASFIAGNVGNNSREC